MMKDMAHRHSIFSVSFGFALILLTPLSALAATLYFSPATQTVTVGQAFTLSVDASSPDQPMNAASGDISFPGDRLRVLSVSNKLSAMNLWVQNPTFSNAVGGGTIDFAGIVLNPGFTGTGANVITIRFQALAPGTAALSFSNGSILANDGSGTNILAGLGNGRITVVPAKANASGLGTGTEPGGGTGVTPPAAATSVVAGYVPETRAVTQFLTWGIVVLGLVMLGIVTIGFYVIYRLRRMRISLSRDLASDRKELREDMRRIEREMRERPGTDVKHEIDHIDEDIKKDIKDHGPTS